MTTPSDAPAKPGPNASDAAVYLAFAWLLLFAFCAASSFGSYRHHYNDWTFEGPPQRRSDGAPLANDFAQFVAVARAWESGRIQRVYDWDEQMRLVREVAQQPPDKPWPFEERTLTYSYPPFMLWLSRPLVGLDYRTAFYSWSLASLGLLVLVVAVFRRELAEDRRVGWLVALTFLASPFVMGNFVAGQIALLGVLALALACFCLVRGRDFLAGLCISVLFYKPILGLLLGPVLLYQGRWRLVAGVAVGGFALFVAGLAAGPGLYAEWLAALRNLKELAQSMPGYFDKHFGWLAFVAIPTGLPQNEFGWPLLALWWGPVALVVVLLFWAWSQPWRPDSPRFAALLSATILATSFVAPYHFFYDVSIVGVAMVYSVKTWRLRPLWHAYAEMLAFFVMALGSANPFDTEICRRDFGFAVQLAPLGTLAWFLVEVRAARMLPAAAPVAAPEPAEALASSRLDPAL